MHHSTFLTSRPSDGPMPPCNDCGQPSCTGVGSFNLLKAPGERGGTKYQCASCWRTSTLLTNAASIETMHQILASESDPRKQALAQVTLQVAADNIRRFTASRIVPSPREGEPAKLEFEPHVPIDLPDFEEILGMNPEESDSDTHPCFDCGLPAELELDQSYSKVDRGLTGITHLCRRCLNEHWIASTQAFLDANLSKLAREPARSAVHGDLEKLIRNAQEELQFLKLLSR